MVNKIIHGNCLDKLKELPENSVDSIVTDPPYHLVSIVKRFGGENSRNTPAMNTKEGGVFARKAKGFMGKEWDGVDENGMGIANNPVMWAECLRVLKPGGHLLAFSGTRTYHRMAVAIEDAGFEVRDMIEWVYGSGFPKSLNIGKAVDKLQGNEREKIRIDNHGTRIGAVTTGGTFGGEQGGYNLGTEAVVTKGTSEWEGWGTALKPAHEPICVARKPLAEKTVAENCLKYGTGGINIDESRVGTEERENPQYGNGGDLLAISKGGEQKWDGTKETVSGRFPANLIHDNSEEVRECFPETEKGGYPKLTKEFTGKSNITFRGAEEREERINLDSGNASRFFKSIIYQAKASKSERNRGCEGLEETYKQRIWAQSELSKTDFGEQTNKHPTTNNHPTVKPIALMEYLIKMVTPKGGIVLDPFAGSGSTLVAAKQNGFNYIGIEMTEEYIPIIEARLK